MKPDRKPFYADVVVFLTCAATAIALAFVAAYAAGADAGRQDVPAAAPIRSDCMTPGQVRRMTYKFVKQGETR